MFDAWLKGLFCYFVKPAVTILGFSVQNNSSSTKFQPNTAFLQLIRDPGCPWPATMQNKDFVHSWQATRSPLLLHSPRHQKPAPIFPPPVHPAWDGEETGLHTSTSPPRAGAEAPGTSEIHGELQFCFIFKPRANALASVILQIKYLTQLWHLSLDW